MGTKYVFVTGGVVSGLGKGITAASLGRLLKNRGYKVTIQKFDPYINVDPGIMSPLEHGEVFLTDDGAETDLDLGHYERFINESLTKKSSITSGKIYYNVLNKERSGYYGGKTVQVIPHITNEIKERIYSFEDQDIDVVITEIGGTVGDIEGLPFLEAIRQIGIEKEREDVLYIHVTYLPYISGSDELKSKPTQHSVKELQSLGIKPDVLVCRTDIPLEKYMREKIALFCNVKGEDVIENSTADNIYAVPLNLEEKGLAAAVCRHLNLSKIEPQNGEWEKMINNIRNIKDEIKIAIVTKYVQLHDAYLSVMESLRHGGYANNVNVNLDFISSADVNDENVKNMLSNYDGVVIPGGFETQGIEGKISTVKYVRENNIPFLGICLGMQMAVVEFARNVLGLEDANSEEFDSKTKNPVIHKDDSNEIMRLGAYPCILDKNSKAYDIYGKEEISERHRHNFEFNNKYKERFEEAGLKCSGISPDGKLVEVVELATNDFFVASQFQPEYKSRPDSPHPLISKFIYHAKMGK